MTDTKGRSRKAKEELWLGRQARQNIVRVAITKTKTGFTFRIIGKPEKASRQVPDAK